METDKRALRKAIGTQKRALTAEQIETRSAALAQRLYQTRHYKAARSLYAYLSFNQEVRTEPIIRQAWKDGKRVAVPKIVGRDMVFIWLDSFDDLLPQGNYGILEPASDGPVADDETALILMPGLAFDAQGHRIGYGGGYYDRYLSAHPGHPTVALCYPFQLFQCLLTEDHDIPVDLVITEQ